MSRPRVRLGVQPQLTTLDFEGSKRITLPVGPRGMADAVLLHDPPTPAEVERAIDVIEDALTASRLTQTDRGELVVRHHLPYSDLDSLTEAERDHLLATTDTLEWSHSLTDQIGGQTEAGFVITGLYEDAHGDHPLGQHAPTYIATRAVKPLV